MIYRGPEARLANCERRLGPVKRRACKRAQGGRVISSTLKRAPPSPPPPPAAPAAAADDDHDDVCINICL